MLELRQVRSSVRFYTCPAPLGEVFCTPPQSLASYSAFVCSLLSSLCFSASFSPFIAFRPFEVYIAAALDVNIFRLPFPSALRRLGFYLKWHL